ncbi:MAG: type I-E CRISPR-associated protein Cas7/Cse4/CasC [Myxococcota bacterium]
MSGGKNIMESRFLQIHTLTSYPGALLNRDDVGFAKRLPFGGATRTRISSQCLKRHWRRYEGEGALAELAPLSVRSRLTFDRHVRQPLVEEGVPEETARLVTEALMEKVLGLSPKKKAKKGKEEDTEDAAVETGQVTVFGRPELEYILSEARALCEAKPKDKKACEKAIKERFDRDARKNLDAMRCSTGIDAALFGRMVTSDLLARGNAAVHVAHAFTVHGEEAESDYFSAVDDLRAAEEELGSGHIGSTELTSGLYYGYVVIDIPLLVSNVEGCERADWKDADREFSGRIIERLIRIIATVSPGAKLGSTAPHAYAQLVLVEAGPAQPRTLANAFLKPVSGRPDLLGNAYGALDDHIQELDGMYGAPAERSFAGLGPKERLSALAEAGAESLDDVASFAARQVTT